MVANKARIYALTGSVAAITATGAWYGAGLNMRQEYKQVQTFTIVYILVLSSNNFPGKTKSLRSNYN
ncbi:uncharacterized protein RHO25_001583 [Cercospora beticola]|uniref:HIG1 domain-containing protein n=1 Tax=Cercospora beticola TaxID=122368 RepID=A0ABZ0NBV4_CERBT|nr:hypothetical protein RHO25_001583 [Cercospora beticola]CAK1354634.1 unnamed protein product [Cercospora beticola]